MADFLLLESGDRLLLESGDGLLLESSTPGGGGGSNKLYFSNIAPLYTPAFVQGSWDQTASAQARALIPSPKTNGGAQTNPWLGGTNGVDPHRRLLARFISAPLAAQTISGTVDLIAITFAFAGTTALAWAVHIYVTQGDSDTPRGTLLNNYADTSANAWTGTQTGRNLEAPQTLSSLAVSEGDRIVVELGFIARTTADVSGWIWHGTTTSSGAELDDIVDGDTAVDRAPFIEFSETLLWADSLEQYVTQVQAEVMEDGGSAADELFLTHIHAEAMEDGGSAPDELYLTHIMAEVMMDNIEPPDPGGVVPSTVNFPQGVLPRNPKRFVKVRFKNGEEIAIADTTLRDSASWHSGLKKARLSYISNIEMEESRRGYRGKSCTIRILDKDNEWRQRASQRTIEGSYWTVYLVDDDIRFAEGEPYQIYGGHCVGHTLVSGYEFEIQCEDWLSRYIAEEDQPLMPPKMLRNSDLDWVPTSFEGKASPIALGKLINGRGVLPNIYFGQSNMSVIFTGGVDVDVDIHLFSELAMSQIVRMTYTPVTWSKGSVVEIGDVYRPTEPNEHLYRATTAGTTGDDEPDWPLGAGATVNDNGIIWEEYDDDDGTRRFIVPESVYGDALVIPGHAGWNAATGLPVGTNWVDYGTPLRRYGGVAFVRSDHRFAKALREGKMRLFMDTYGANENPDGTERYFSTPEDIIVFLILNYLVTETDGITYAGNPTLDGTHGMVNMDSVEDAKAVGLLDVPLTGIVSAAYIGAEGSQKKVFNVIDDFLLGGRLGISTNRFGQIELHRQNPDEEAVLKFKELGQHISFHAGPSRDDHKNRIEYYYGVNYGPIVETNPDDPDANKFESGLQVVEDLDSQTETGRVKRFNLKNVVVREQESADAIAEAYLIQFTGPDEAKDGPRDFHIITPLVEGLGRIVEGTPIEIKIGTVLAVSDSEGYGVEGYVDKRCRVRKIIYNTEDGVTELFGRVLEP